MKPISKILRGLTFSVGLAGLTIVAPAIAKKKDNSDPALWVVKDKDTTIYLFGTFHVMRPGMTWFDEGIRDAFDKSDTIVTEIIEPANPADIGPLMVKYATAADGKTVTSRLTPQQRVTYQASLTSAGLPYQALEKYDPWFVGLNLSMAEYAKAGTNPESGSEATLTSALKGSDKKRLALETAEQQFQWLDSAPMNEQIDGLMTIIENKDAVKSQIEKMITAWNKGNADGIAALMNEDLDKTPVTAKTLLFDRNARWADWIAKRLDTPGTVFMAVGAGHLAGKKSVQDYLRTNHSIKAARVNY